MRHLVLSFLFLSACASGPQSRRAPANDETAPVVEQAFLHSSGAYISALVDWEKLKGSQAKACAPALDSKEILRGHTTPVAVLLLHGFSQAPEKLQPYLDFWNRYNVNVIAPRLANHYNENLTDLDKAKHEDWVAQAEKAYQVAMKLGQGKVIVMGYSLGGLLSSRLALKFPNSTVGAVLLSPAWRVMPNIDVGTNLGWLIGWSANRLKKWKYACDGNLPYISSAGGAEVDDLSANLEYSFGGSYPDTGGSAIRRFLSRTPTLLAIVEGDSVVDSGLAREIFLPTESGFRTLLIYPGVDHSTFVLPKGLDTDFLPRISATPSKGRLLKQIEGFLKLQLDLEPMPGFPRFFAPQEQPE